MAPQAVTAVQTIASACDRPASTCDPNEADVVVADLTREVTHRPDVDLPVSIRRLQRGAYALACTYRHADRSRAAARVRHDRTVDVTTKELL